MFLEFLLANTNLMYSYSNFLTASDRYGIPGSEAHLLESLSSKLKYPVEDIIRAVREVGYDKDDVEEYIRDRHNRS